MRALLEGVAYEMRLNLNLLAQSGIHIDELRAVGGGARSKVWTQLKADVLNKPITTVKVAEAGCLGVAMLAKAAATGIPVAVIVDEWVQLSGTVFPQPDNAKHYEERFEKYLHLYPAIKGLAREGSRD